MLKTKEIISTRLIESSALSSEDAITLLKTSIKGLSSEEVEKRYEHYGANAVAHERPDPWYKQLLDAFVNPFIAVLAALIVISLFTDVLFASKEEQTFKTIIVLSTMILVSVILRFIQEFRSAKAAEGLKAMVRTTATVVRKSNDKPKEVSITELVPGDIVTLSAGDMIPADVRVLNAKDLFISQAVLTGESIPLEKTPHTTATDTKINPLELENICFMGTNVVSGSATALVVATGSEAYFGKMARDISGKRTLTSFDKGINKVSWVLIRFMFVMVPIVFLINGVSKGNWLDALLFAVSVAVGLTPEMLPMVVTANLARGAMNMAKHKTIVKRLNSIQNFGAMDILCTDKTGTLTLDKIILERHLDIYGRKNLQVLKYAYLNSFYQTGLKNVLDVAVIGYGEENNIDSIRHFYHKVDEIPFDFVRRRMSVIVGREEENTNLLVCKGAVEEVIALCTHADELDEQGNVVATKLLDSETRKKIRDITKEINAEGLRVLAVAYKMLPAEERTYGVEDESEMMLAGYIAFLDPPKETAVTAIAALRDHGVAVKIITGDNEIVTRKICKDVGLDFTHIMMGNEIDGMSDEKLASKVEETTIFAKMSPMQKSRIIRSLQSLGHVVGYMGDGINDAAALRDADVGISVDTAVDIAKESADIILLEKSLMVLEEGVLEGRKTFGNIIKYVKMTASSNFGNVFSILIASIALPFLPMLAVQLLVQNLLYDISQISIPWDNVDEEYMKRPRKWEAGGIVRFMFCIGPISSIFDVITFMVLWYVLGANTPEHQSLFQSGWFVEGLLSQTLIVHMIRTQKIPFFGSRAAMPVIVLTLIIMAIGIYIPFSTLGSGINLIPLPLLYFPLLFVILLGYCVVIQLVKNWYIKKFGGWM